MSSKKSKYYRLSIIFILATLAGLFIYQSAIIKVISAVLHREGSSHGIFVPFLSLYFLWLLRDKLKEIEPQYNFFWHHFSSGRALLSCIRNRRFSSSVFRIYYFYRWVDLRNFWKRAFQKHHVSSIFSNYNDPDT